MEKKLQIVAAIIAILGFLGITTIWDIISFRNTKSEQTKLSVTTSQSIGTERRAIPIAKVPITPAAAVLPSWAQSEDIDGNYPIVTGLYVGALGKRPFKLVVSSVDTANKRVSGYSETSTATAAFEGTYSFHMEEPDSRVASNVIAFRTWVFEATLFESEGLSGNGVFQLRFSCTDAQGASVFGTWTSYDGRLYREVKLTDTYTARER